MLTGRKRRALAVTGVDGAVAGVDGTIMAGVEGAVADIGAGDAIDAIDEAAAIEATAGDVGADADEATVGAVLLGGRTNGMTGCVAISVAAQRGSRRRRSRTSNSSGPTALNSSASARSCGCKSRSSVSLAWFSATNSTGQRKLSGSCRPTRHRLASARAPTPAGLTRART